MKTKVKVVCFDTSSTTPLAMKSPEELHHQETARSNDLRNKLIAMEEERNNILAALIDEGVETLARVLAKARLNADMEIGHKLLRITHGGSPYQRNA